MSPPTATSECGMRVPRNSRPRTSLAAALAAPALAAAATSARDRALAQERYYAHASSGEPVAAPAHVVRVREDGGWKLLAIGAGALVLALAAAELLTLARLRTLRTVT
jgi:hypothetical protein